MRIKRFIKTKLCRFISSSLTGSDRLISYPQTGRIKISLIQVADQPQNRKNSEVDKAQWDRCFRWLWDQLFFEIFITNLFLWKRESSRFSFTSWWSQCELQTLVNDTQETIDRCFDYFSTKSMKNTIERRTWMIEEFKHSRIVKISLHLNNLTEEFEWNRSQRQSKASKIHRLSDWCRINIF